MRFKFFSVFVVALAAVMVMVPGVAPIEASQYLGEVTWNAESSGGNFTMKVAISRVTGSYYEVQGQAQDAYGTAIFSGGGVLVGENLILTVTGTPTDAQEAVVMQIKIDKSSNNGFFYTVKVGGPINSGTLTVSGNPIILATTNEASTMLLLND
jgi:hypothetical protein